MTLSMFWRELYDLAAVEGDCGTGALNALEDSAKSEPGVNDATFLDYSGAGGGGGGC